jgi:hypothetical protein
MVAINALSRAGFKIPLIQVRILKSEGQDLACVSRSGKFEGGV